MSAPWVGCGGGHCGRSVRDSRTGETVTCQDVCDPASERERDKAAEARRQARARGEYVPSPGAGLHATAMVLTLGGESLFCTVTPVREDVADGIRTAVYRVVPNERDIDPQRVLAVLAAHQYEARMTDSGMWVRTTSAEPQPLDDTPPF